MRGNLLLEESKSPQEKDRRRRRKEGELIGFMDEHGICTDASMATHIENVGASYLRADGVPITTRVAVTRMAKKRPVTSSKSKEPKKTEKIEREIITRSKAEDWKTVNDAKKNTENTRNRGKM
eukprot:GEMP01098597.1.p3 GENE.GEMP01098597.1~~GEMP01098597.1.p3  ORF type:complete len:123 (+),score=24.49 GEMP01098597.1:94-462(+)